MRPKKARRKKRRKKCLPRPRLRKVRKGDGKVFVGGLIPLP